MKSLLVQPYLFFGGRCEEALTFYTQSLGVKVEFMMRFDQSPTPMPPGSIPPGFETKVMHATFTLGDNTLMASDGSAAGPDFGGFALSLEYPSQGEAVQAFTALSAGGEVTMPIGKTFWSPCYGMLVDRFGVKWMVTARGAV